MVIQNYSACIYTLGGIKIKIMSFRVGQKNISRGLPIGVSKFAE